MVPPPFTLACWIGGCWAVAGCDIDDDGCMCGAGGGIPADVWLWTGTKPGRANGTSNIGLVVFEAIGRIDGVMCLMVVGGWAMADTVGVGRAWTVSGWVEVLDEQRQAVSGRAITRFPAGIGATGITVDGPAVAVTIGYGVVAVRAWPAILGFGTFGVQTAQGSSPTKRSPTGLASGCAWEVIFSLIEARGKLIQRFCQQKNQWLWDRAWNKNRSRITQKTVWFSMKLYDCISFYIVHCSIDESFTLSLRNICQIIVILICSHHFFNVFNKEYTSWNVKK